MSMKHFETFEEIAVRIALENNRDLNELEKRGRDMLAEYKQTGNVRLMPLDALETDAYCYLPLIRHLIRKSQSVKRVASPVEEKTDSSWMADSSFCFVNVRALGTKPGTTGNLVDALKILPTLRVTSIHLAPFFECSLQNAYGIDTVTVLNEDVVNKEYLDRGLSAEEQLRLFTDVVHLLGMTVGFDLEPHTSQFSRIAIEHPTLFRWLKFRGSRHEFAWGLSQEAMLEERNQILIRTEVAAIRAKVLKKHGLQSLEEKGKDPETKKAHYEIIGELIKNELWTLPSHTWKGAGLPEYSHYVSENGCEYPEFKYISTDREDHREHAFGTLTPYRFYDGLPLNEIPRKGHMPAPSESTIKFFAGIFPALYEKYRFDYIRFDYVDHVFDSVAGKSGKFPVSDRATPFVLKRAIFEGRKHGRDYVGAMAERMGEDIEQYSTIGFDLLLGCEALAPIENGLVLHTVKLNKHLHRLNEKNARKVSVQFAVDSHDTGHPLFNSTPMLKYGAKGVALRLFLSRFGGAGKGIRPKYEVIGLQDGTTGLYRANINAVALEWKSDKAMFDYYHRIEDLFDECKALLKKGHLADAFEIDEHTAYWVIKGKGYYFAAVVNTSKEESSKNVLIGTIEPFEKATLINPYTGERSEAKKKLIVRELKPLEARLFYIEDLS